MDEVRIEIVGLDKLHKVLTKEAIDVAMKGMTAGVYAEANDIFNESQAQVPVATGTLRSSGEVSPPAVSAHQVSVEIGYGGAAADYALPVHEKIEAYHAPPTKAKYLEDPMIAAARGMGSRIAKYVLAELNRLRT